MLDHDEQIAVTCIEAAEAANRGKTRSLITDSRLRRVRRNND